MLTCADTRASTRLVCLAIRSIVVPIDFPKKRKEVQLSFSFLCFDPFELFVARVLLSKVSRADELTSSDLSKVRKELKPTLVANLFIMGAEQSQMDPMYMKAGLTKEEVSFHTYRPRACRTSLFTVFFFLFLRRVRLRPSYPSYFLHRRLFALVDPVRVRRGCEVSCNMALPRVFSTDTPSYHLERQLKRTPLLLSNKNIRWAPVGGWKKCNSLFYLA